MIRKLCFFLFLSLTTAAHPGHTRRQGQNVRNLQSPPPQELMQLSETPRIYLFKGFLSDDECHHIIQVAQPHLIASKVIDEQNQGEKKDPRRSSQGFFIPNHWNDSILKSIEQRIASVTGLPMENGENLHVLHYSVGGEYQPHYDYFNPSTPGGAECLSRGGQRVASFIMYLNTPEAGGATIFPRAHIQVTPVRGDAILFYNCTPNGMVDPESFHGGAPVIAGEKWIMTKWIRERVFR